MSGSFFLRQVVRLGQVMTGHDSLCQVCSD